MLIATHDLKAPYGICMDYPISFISHDTLSFFIMFQISGATDQNLMVSPSLLTHFNGSDSFHSGQAITVGTFTRLQGLHNIQVYFVSGLQKT